MTYAVQGMMPSITIETEWFPRLKDLFLQFDRVRPNAFNQRVCSFLQNISFLVSLIFLTGCSVHFAQLDLINQIRQANSDPLAGLSWDMNWNGNSYILYPVTGEGNQTFFAGHGDHILTFEGFDLTDIAGFLPNAQVGRIEPQGGELLYFENDLLLARHACQPWEILNLEDGGLHFTRSCEGIESYNNEFVVDSNGEMSFISFRLHPEYPAMTMTPHIDPIN